MNITQLRNATVVLEFKGPQGSPVSVLVDPMLARGGALPSLKWVTGARRRNPLVDLPAGSDEVLARVTHGLITHCRKGHFDHLDRAGAAFLKRRGLPVFCMPDDKDHLVARGIAAAPLQGAVRQPFFHGHITPIPCVHGRGWVGRLMAHGFGYFIELPGEPTVYLAGDTLLSDEVAHCLSTLKPDVSVLPAGGARFDLGGEILMDEADLCHALALTPGRVVANHLEALDHCPVTRQGLADAAWRAGVGARLHIPADGQVLTFPGA